MSALPRAKGELFRYAESTACVAFEYELSRGVETERRGDGETADANTNASISTSTSTKLAVVAVGGLTDGFFALPYLPHLAELLSEDNRKKEEKKIEWSLISPLLSSSHRGWGTSSLDSDAAELLELSAHLKSHRGIEGIVLLGHSTGCQDAVRYAERERGRERERSKRSSNKEEEGVGGEQLAPPPLFGVALQAPVSDRECFFLDAESAPIAHRRLERAREAIREGKDPEKTVIDFMSEWDGAPLSASRWLSLAERRRDDDYFSSDFSDEELSERLRALGGGEDGSGKTSAIPTLIIASLREQYLPKEYDTAAHARRLADAINRLRTNDKEEAGKEGTAEAVALDGDHALRGAEAEAARFIFEFLSTKCCSRLRPPL